MSSIRQIFAGESKIAEFFNSRAFIWMVAALTLLFWTFKQELAGLAVLCVLIAAVLFLCKDATCVIVPLTCIFFTFSDTGITFEGRESWLVLVALPLAGFIYNLVRFEGDRSMKGYSFTILLCLIPWCLQGITRENRAVLGALACVGVGVAFALCFFALRSCSRREGSALSEYFVNVLFVLGVMITCQILIGEFRDGYFRFENEALNLGWGTRNIVAAVYSCTVPAAFYYAAKWKKLGFLMMLVGAAEYVVCLLLQSRGVSAVLTLIMLALLAYTIVTSKNRIAVSITAGVLIIGGILTATLFDGLMYRIIHRFVEDGVYGTGRLEIYHGAIETFLKFPIFGAGFDYRWEQYYIQIPHSHGPVYWHSTPLQIVACFGLLGFVVYLYNYYWRYRVLLTDFDPLKFILLASTLCLELYSLIDNTVFQPVGFLIIMITAMCAEKGLAKEQATPTIFRLADKIKRRRAV